jgi:hypothetical protein
LPVSGFAAIQVDDAHQHVFVTGAPADNTAFVATDFAGQTVKTFSGEAGASGMVLSGTTLYVARCGTTAIDTFDTATLTKSGSITVTESIGAPCDLAETGGRLWFTSGGHLDSVTLDASHTTVSLSELGGDLSAVSAAPNRLLVTNHDYAEAVLYDVSGQTPQMLGLASIASVAELVPGGQAALIVRTTQENIYDVPLPSLYPAASQYDFRIPAAALTITADGTYFAAATESAYAAFPSISLYQRGAGSPVPMTASLPEPAPILGMAFAGDGSRLFVVEDGGSTTMRVITSPLRSATPRRSRGISPLAMVSPRWARMSHSRSPIPTVTRPHWEA